ncbi:hypothetical protein KFE25_010118 [Diacronema lutheri]|nr:hypothetical protein KFE25_010118 [Diacronema lutheri]
MAFLLACVPARAIVLNPPVFLSGGLAASFSHTVSVPIDVVKTRIQSDPVKHANGALACAATIVAEEGPAVLLAGGTSTLLGYFLQGSLKYGLYDAFKPELAGALPSDAPKIAVLLLAGVSAEAIASLVLCPLEALRIRAVCDASYAQLPLPVGLARILRSGDAFGGLVPIWLKMCPYTALQLSTYELTRASTEQLLPGGGGLSGQLGCAVVAAVVASLGSQPGDALLSAVNQRAEEGFEMSDGASLARPSLLDVAGELGATGLFRGTGARLLQMLIIVVVQLVANDFFRELSGARSVGR